MNPLELGLPPKFSVWRPGQQEAYELLSKDPRRFQVAQLPPGVGKTAVGMALAIAAAKEGKHTTYLTVSKALQDQLMGDFSEVGLVDVRGMQNYQCVAEGGTCDEGSCTDGAACWAKASGCSYFDAVRAASKSLLRTTNYAFHFTQAANFQNALGNTDLLICDEAALIPDQASNFLRVVVLSQEVHIPTDASLWDHQQWRDWAKGNLMGVSGQVRQKMPRWKRKKLEDLKKRLKALSEMPEEWVIDEVYNGWSFEPLWPGPFLGNLLWQGVKKVILLSATITKEQLPRMAVTDFHWIEQPSVIPVSQRPIYFHSIADMMSRRATEMDLWRLVEAIDSAIDTRLDRKGLIHSVSYERARFIVKNSRWGELMITHESRGAKEAIELFKASDPPAILVSPAVHTGVDFPFDFARWQGIPKVPFAPPSALLKARTQEDRAYPYTQVLKGLEQMVGRVARDPKDVGETFIWDSCFSWLYRKYGRFTTKSFQRAVREVDAPPPPIVLLK